MIGLDWGTTSLRAYRLDQAGAVLEKRESKSGILSVKPGGFPDELCKIAGDWLDACHAGAPGARAEGAGR